MGVQDVEDSGVFFEVQNLGNLLGNWAPVMATATTFFGFLFGPVAALANATIATLAGLLDSIDISAFSHADFSTLQMAQTVNAIFPLDEFLLMGVAYITAWGVILAIRWIKSIIPTVAN